MPELAEVEYYRKQWDPGLGETVARVSVHPRARVYRDTPAAALRGLAGRRLLRSFAHGKQMLFEFSGGTWLGIHLGMSGKLFASPLDREEEARDHLALFTPQRRLVFSDTRMFGKVTLDLVAGADGAHCGDCAGAGEDEASSPPLWWRELPPELLSPGFTKARVARFAQRRAKTPLKTLLLDQSAFPGVGNWMADEVCWRLGLDPRLPAGSLGRSECADLWKALRQVSRDALRIIGTDWGDPPDSWLMKHRWRDGGHCPRRGCGAPLVREELRGRTTCRCPGCQG